MNFCLIIISKFYHWIFYFIRENIMIETIMPIIYVLLGFLLGILWDQYKNKQKIKDFIINLKNELENNLERVKNTINELPSAVSIKLTANSNSANFTAEEILTIPFSFPKPFVTDTWHSLIMSGLISNIPKDTLKKLYKVYDIHFSADYLGKLTVELFQIISVRNTLDPQTSTSFNQFCRVGVLSQIFALSKQIPSVIEDLKHILNDK